MTTSITTFGGQEARRIPSLPCWSTPPASPASTRTFANPFPALDNDVQELDARVGGALRYEMIADSPEMIAAMTLGSVRIFFEL
jgi:hypothetical protein